LNYILFKIIKFDIIGIAINQINYVNTNNVLNTNQKIEKSDVFNTIFNNTIDDNIIINFIDGYKQNIKFIINKINDQIDKKKSPKVGDL
jgi:hypothetical protein